MSGPLGVGSQAFIMALCMLVWLLMALLPMAIFRLRHRSLQKWITLFVLNAALWAVWIVQYRLIAVNPLWADGTVLIESLGIIIILFTMMFRERGRKREEYFRRLKQDG